MSTAAAAEVRPTTIGAEVPADALPEWLKLPRRAVAIVLFLAVAFWSLSWLPLWHTDVWVHLKYGEWIWSHGSLPSTEQFMPLAEGVPYLDGAWLSQLVLFGMFSAVGIDGICLLHAGTLVVIAGILLSAAYRATGRFGAAVVGTLAMTPLLWPHLMAVRPAMFGVLLFVLLLYIVTSRTWHSANWFLVPALFLCWVNLHGSFLIGLSVLACCVAGHAIDAWRCTTRFGSILRDGATIRWLLVSELALVACLANPYGPEIFRATVTAEQSANLQTLTDWAPLSVQSWAGIAFAGSIVLLIWLLRHSRRPVRGGEGLVLLVFGVAALTHTREVLWWWLLLPFLYLPHVGELLARMRPSMPNGETRNFKNTIMAAALTWIALVGSGPGRGIIHHKPRGLEAAVSRFTPIETAEYLREHPPEGQVFHPAEWGDWLVWSGPSELKCFVTSQIHLVPEEIWAAYQKVYSAQGDWERTLQGLGVQTVVIDRERQKELFKAVRLSANWTIVHEDRIAVVAERVASDSDSGS